MNIESDERPPGRWVWSLPLELGPRGCLRHGVARDVEETARLVLEVAPGERPLLPEFGWRGHLLPRLEPSVERAVAGVLAEEALGRWAPDLAVQRVDVEEASEVDFLLVLHRAGERHRLRVRRRGSVVCTGRHPEAAGGPS